MQALVCTAPGKLDYKELKKPDLMKDHAIIRVCRIGICGTDLHAYEGTQPYFNYPRILGHEISGVLVEMDGNGSDTFYKGEAVSILPYYYCGNCIACRQGRTNCCAKLKVAGVHVDGGMAEYIAVPSYALVHGEQIDFDSLSLIEPFSIGAHGISRAGVQPGEMVLVIGAGPIGLGTMHFAMMAGAQVIALDVNPSRLQFCRDVLKVQHTINGGKEDIVQQLATITGGDMPGVVIDATGNLNAIEAGFTYLSAGGRYVLIGLQKDNINFSHPEFHKREATMMSSRNATRNDFNQVIGSIRDQSLDPRLFITDRVKFGNIKNEFELWINQSNGVIKAMVEFD